MRRNLIAGNWKMNGSRRSVRALLRSLVEGIGAGRSNLDIVVCPPALFVPMTEQLISGSRLMLGAQNAAFESSGAFTGEIAPEMFKEFSVNYVITGHSERRILFGESDQVISRKFAAALNASLVPILCVGETLAQRDSGEAERVVTAQLEAVLADSSIASFASAVIAYEPIWAIGTGHTASPEQAQDMHRHIRSVLAVRDETLAAQIQIIYGGSVNAANAEQLFAQPDIDGGLVGGASLNAEEFIAICNSVS
jgi:triosephosphate isomerase